MICVLTSIALLVSDVYCKIYFKEEFNDDKWENTWINSEYGGKEFGKFVLTAGNFFADPEINKGIKTSQDVRFYGLSTKFEPFTNKDNVLVLQFTVKYEEKLDCGGGYIKLFDCSLEPKNLHGETPYLIMFGPDVCGSDKKVHVIFNYRGKNFLIKRSITYKDDQFTHLYTLILKPDNSYVVKIDNIQVQDGELENDWDFLPPRIIKDPSVSKPKDWVDDAEIVDVNDKKPEDWDQPQFVLDETAFKPEDWDDDIDGDWEPPKINNPAYKGEWKPRLLKNPNYKGPWIHPKINNPVYEPDPYLYKYDEICGVGFDLWQVTSGTIFDNILIADNEEEALRHGVDKWASFKDKEMAAKDNLTNKDNDETPEDYEDEHDDIQESDFQDEHDDIRGSDFQDDIDGHDEL